MTKVVRRQGSAVDVCAFEDLADGQIHEVTIGTIVAAAVKVGEDVSVFSASCPHRGAPLTKGRVTHPLTSSAPGEIDVNRDCPTISCPWHGWEFRLDTGTMLVPEATRMKVFDSEVVDGRVVVYRRASG